MADEAVSAVREALEGRKFNFHALDQLAFNKLEAGAARAELIPLLLQLASRNPEAAKLVPENTVEALLYGLTLDEVLKTTGLDSKSLDNDQLRPLLLSQAAAKASEEDANTRGDAHDLLEKSLQMITEPLLDTQSVSSIEKIIGRLPRFAVTHTPLQVLFDGPAELKSRLMAINLALLKQKVVPPLDVLIWNPLDSEDGDVLLAALETDYVGDLVEYFTREKTIQKSVHTALFELCRRYRKTPESFLTNSIERVLAKVARLVEGLFLELDAQHLLVRADRPSLIAQIPASYVVGHHPQVVEQLELNSKNLYAVANLTQDPRSLQLLPLTSTRVLHLPVPSQLILVAAATNTKDGALYFKEKYFDALQNAWNMPEAQEYVDLKATLRRNLSQWGIRMRSQPNIQLG